MAMVEENIWVSQMMAKDDRKGTENPQIDRHNVSRLTENIITAKRAGKRMKYLEYEP